MSSTAPFQCYLCSKTCKSQSGYTRHIKAVHDIDPALFKSKLRRFKHPKLNARPCTADGHPLPQAACPHELLPPLPHPENPWFPFHNRHDFDWATHYFKELGASKRQIGKGLDLWLASTLQAGSKARVPWHNAHEMYSTIDAIQQGDVPWNTAIFKYTGPVTINSPTWMLEDYELCFRDVRLLLHEQLANPEFRGHIDYVPYQEFDQSDHRLYSNLMSGNWAWNQCDKIAEDVNTHGCMFLPVISGSDKTTTSVATGHQEFHPVYVSAGNLSNIARRSHNSGVMLAAILPIPKASRNEWETGEYKKYCRQLFHACLTYIFASIKKGATMPEVIRCADGHYRRTIYGLGPNIADYPEQVWLAGIVSGWCPKCDALPENLDAEGSRWRQHEITDYLINNFDTGVIWTDYGVRADVVPFTHGFPRADIHELLAPDLLHQVIKGVFKDHLVTWICTFLLQKHGVKRGNELIQDIDRRVAAVPPFPGLRRFPEGRDFHQWTGDDSKALMKIYLAAITGHVPREITRTVSAFINFCYIIRRNAITARDLIRLQQLLRQFHESRKIFIDSGTTKKLANPRQHALSHYIHGIEMFGAPNGLCSSITESKHIRAIKEPWRHSNRRHPLAQMTQRVARLEKLAALRSSLEIHGLMWGTTSQYMEHCITLLPDSIDSDEDSEPDGSDAEVFSGDADGDANSTDNHAYNSDDEDYGEDDASLEELGISPCKYPRDIYDLATHINQPKFPVALRQFLYHYLHPNINTIPSPSQLPEFHGKLDVYHSAIARYFAPSDLCGASGIHRARIRSHPRWFRDGKTYYPRYDTVFVNLSNEPGLRGMAIGRVLLFFSFYFHRRVQECALVAWYGHRDDEPDEETGLWVVEPEVDTQGQPMVEVISIDSICRGAHLLPVYGEGFLPEKFDFRVSLDAFQAYFVNSHIDYHAHELLDE